MSEDMVGPVKNETSRAVSYTFSDQKRLIDMCGPTQAATSAFGILRELARDFEISFCNSPSLSCFYFSYFT